MIKFIISAVSFVIIPLHVGCFPPWQDTGILKLFLSLQDDFVYIL